MNNNIRAITFDLFDTLIVLKKSAFDEALAQLVTLVRQAGFYVPDQPFRDAYRDAAKSAFAAAGNDGKERHNSLWLVESLDKFGYTIAADDPLVERIISAYFADFVEYVDLIPGTKETLQTLSVNYRLALLSNFTHGPAARAILQKFDLTDLFETIIISGEFGFRKPHPAIFGELLDNFRLTPGEVAYIGDNWVDDMRGARDAGLLPVWTHIARTYRSTLSDQMLPKPLAKADFAVTTVKSWQELLAEFGG